MDGGLVHRGRDENVERKRESGKEKKQVRGTGKGEPLQLPVLLGIL